jgi:pimeloyl-ACP methyl ester carboxylesterase
MRRLKNCLKWISLTAGVLLGLIILMGLVFRFFAAKPQPPGEMVDIGGFKLQINTAGVKNRRPTLVIESGAGAPGEYYHWLSEGLKDSMRVVRYDRAGIGYSELATTPRHPETVARELHRLLELAGESPPYIMAGHSYGAHYIRIFAKLYPDEVAALVFLDPSHPEASERLKLPKDPWFITPLYRIGALLGDLGILHLYDKTMGPILWAPGLPQEVIDQMTDYTYTGKFLKAYLRGDNKWGQVLKERAAVAKDFGLLPIKTFSGTHTNEKALIRRGIDPEHFQLERKKMQEEIRHLSAKGELFFMDGGHITSFTLKENADFICREILEMLGEL